jgi:hypothetical protein
VVTGCILVIALEDRILLVGDVSTLVVVAGKVLDVSEVSASVGRTEDTVGEVSVISVMGDSVGRTEVGISAVSSVNVAEGVVDVVSSVLVMATVVEGDCIVPAVVSRLMVVGVGVY